MTFATLANLQARMDGRELLLLADRDDDGVADAAVVNAALQDADAEIIGLIGRAVTIDLANVPLNLVRIACEIARYHLYSTGSPPEDVRKRYEDAIRFLRLVADGKAALDGGAGAPSEAASTPSPQAAFAEPGSRIFNRGL